MIQDAVWLSGIVEYEKVEQVMDRIGQVAISIVVQGAGFRRGGRAFEQSRKQNGYGRTHYRKDGRYCPERSNPRGAWGSPWMGQRSTSGKKAGRR